MSKKTSPIINFGSLRENNDPDEFKNLEKFDFNSKQVNTPNIKAVSPQPLKVSPRQNSKETVKEIKIEAIKDEDGLSNTPLSRSLSTAKLPTGDKKELEDLRDLFQ